MRQNITKDNRRRFYRDKFIKLLSEELNYIPQKDEIFIQIDEVDYYFLSNKGYMFSVVGKHIRILKPFLTGKRGKRQEYIWRNSNRIPLKMSAMMMKYFSNKLITEEYSLLPEDQYQNHHIYGYNPSLQPQKLNKADQLQRVPIPIHKKMTQLQCLTVEDLLKASLPEDTPTLYIKNLYDFIKNGENYCQPRIIWSHYDLPTGECTKTYCENTTLEEILSLLSNSNTTIKEAYLSINKQGD